MVTERRFVASHRDVGLRVIDRRGYCPLLLLDGVGGVVDDEIPVRAAFHLVRPAAKADRVEHSCRHLWMRRFVRGLLPTVVLVFGFDWPMGAVSASSLAPAPASSAEDDGHHCRCASRCRGASCCCGPRRARVPDGPAIPAAAPETADGSPCLKAAPCGDPGLPNAPVAAPISKMASLPGCARPVPGTAGRRLPPDVRCVLPSRRASRLDEPPESPPFA
jgi:hypothetical protein